MLRHFISPEMLVTPRLQNILQTREIKVNALIVDEILLISWVAGFRPLVQQQIGFLRARFPSDTVFLDLR